MNIILSFIGTLPNYIIDCIKQIRIFTKDNIFLIYNDYNSPFLEKIIEFNIKLYKYEDVFDSTFDDAMKKNSHNFWKVSWAKGREDLFIKSLERFYLANNLIKSLNLNNNIFLEIDNLIYDDPNKWLSNLKNYNLAIMAHSSDHCASGIMYIKDKNSLEDLLKYFIEYILQAKHNDCPNEMKALFCYYKKNPDKIHFLPILFNDTINNVSKITYENYDLYNSVFDGAAYGIYLGGEDPIHNNGQIIYNKSFDHYLVKCKNYKIEFKDDKKPYIYDFNKNKWVLINNLHIHSKFLSNLLSI
jgi:hypothetical protein